MNQEQIISELKKYFGENKDELKKKVQSICFTGMEYDNWRRFIEEVASGHPFNIEYGIMPDVAEKLSEQEYDKINWGLLGDLSWEMEILLNENVKNSYDWNKELCLRCGGTARMLKIMVSDVIPVFTYETYSKTYSKKGNYYEFAPIKPDRGIETTIKNEVVQAFKQKGFQYIPKRFALRRFKDLYSDCNIRGNASVYDVLFSDINSYHLQQIRLSDKNLKDPTGKDIKWREYYGKDGGLLERHEYRYFSSKNVLLIITNHKNEIESITVWKDTIDEKDKKFRMKLQPNR